MLPVLLVELDAVVLDESLLDRHEEHVASDAAVVPPVEDIGRNGFWMALVIDLHNHIVLSFFQSIGDVEVERREATEVSALLLAVDIDHGFVVDSAEIEQHALVGLWLIVEGATEPYSALVEEETFVLNVPVARNVHLVGGVEIVFYQFERRFLMSIEEEAPRRFFHSVVVEADFLLVDDVTPFSVERSHVLTAIDVADERNLGRCLRLLCMKSRKGNDSKQSGENVANFHSDKNYVCVYFLQK